MTRKHFEAAAQIVGTRLAWGRDEVEAGIIANAFIVLFEQFSPNFDRARFLKACGL